MPISTENTNPVVSEFTRNLNARNLSSVTVKNYVSDITYFFRWLNSSFADYPHHLLLQQITPQTLNNFRHHLSGSLPIKTANRRLSALRSFCQFLFNQNYTPVNSAIGLQNIIPNPSAGEPNDHLLHQFAHDLKLGGAAPTTVTNYVSDARKFLQISPPLSNTRSQSTAKRHLSSWKKFQLFLTQHSLPPTPQSSSPLTPTPIPLPTTHYLSLISIPIIIFILTFVILILLTPPPQLLTPY